MFLVDARLHEIDDGDVVARLTSRTESMTEHESKGRFEHCFGGLLKTGFFIKSENFTSRGQFLIRAREETVDLCPSQPRAALASSFGPMSETRLLCQTFSRNASFRARREPNSFRRKHGVVDVVT